MVTLPNPNPIPNAGYLEYQYEVTPGTTLPGAINSNTVYTQVNRAIIQNESGGLVKSLDNTYVILGDTITYTVVLKNTGNVNAVSVVFKDTIPGYTTYVAGSATVNGVVSGAIPDVGLNVGTIAPNGVATVIFKVLVNSIPPAGNTTIPNSAVVNYDFVYDPTTPSSSSASNLSNTVESFANLAVITNADGGLTKSVDKPEADVLDVLTYTITIKNTGNVAANNVTLKDTIPQGTAFQSNNVTVNGVNTAGNPSTGISLGTLSSGETKVVVFTVSVVSIPNPNKADNQGIINYNYTSNPASVNGKSAVSGSNVVTTTIVAATINTIANGLVKTVDKPYAAVGETITYTIKVQNTGNVEAANVIFTDTVPTDTTLVDVSVDGTLVGSGNPTTGINLGNIASGSIKTVTIRVTVNTIPAVNPIPNSGKIAYDYTVNGTVKSTQNLTNIVSTTVAQASIKNGDGGLVKSTPKTNGKVGDVIPYTIVLKNTGNINATNVLFKDTVPNGTSLNSGSLKLNGSTASGNLTSGVTVGTLIPNGVATITFDVTITTIPAINPIPNEGSVDYSYLVNPTEAPRTASQISNTVTTSIKLALISNGDGGFVKSHDLSFAKVGDTITYTMPIKNTGNVDANNVLIKDTIPNGTSYVASSLTVDGIPNAGSISSGITLGTIVPNAVKTISFKVLVDTIPVPNPIPNQALIDYSFTVDTPNDTNTKNLSNTVLTTIAQAYIRPSDGGLTKLVDKSFADVGETVTYTVVLKNTGNVNATNVKLFDTIPNDTTLVAGSILVNGVAGTGDLVTAGVTVGTIGANSVATVQFKVTVNTIPNPNPLVNKADVAYDYLVGSTAMMARNTTNEVQTQVNTAIITKDNGSLTKAVDKAFADINDIITYTITVMNKGNVNATNVIVKDTIPTDTSYVASSLTVDGTPNAGSISSGVNIGTITPNGSKVVVFKVKVNTIPNPNPIPNEALISYGYKVIPTGTDTTKQALTNNVQTRVNTARISNNDGGLVKTVDKANASVGNTLTYTITVKNTGNVTANNIIFKDTIPTDTTYVSGSVTIDGTPSSSDPMTGVSVGTLAPNGIKVVQFKVTINTIPNPNPIPNQGMVSFDYIVDTVTNTSNSQNNLTNIVSTTVSQAHIRPEDGGLTKTVDKASADVGDVLTYTILLKNTGNVIANNVTVSDTIPNYTSYIPASLKVNNVANLGNIQSGINVGNINPNAVVTVQFQVRVNSIPNPNPITNQAKVGYSFNVGTGTQTEEHLTSIVPTTINNASITNSDGGLIKVASKDFAKIGDTITYTITLSNTGNITANNIVLIDTVPVATTFVTGSVMVNGSSNGSANPNTGITIGSLTPGSSIPVSFDVVVTTIPVPNPIKNQAVVNFNYTVDPANPNGKSSSGISNVVPTTVNTGIIAGTPGDGISKTVDKAFADINETITYTIILKNSGNVAVNSVVLKDTIPNDTTFVSSSVTVNGNSSTDNPSTGINAGTINSGARATITFKVKVNTIPTPNPIPNEAVVNYIFTVNPVTNETGDGGSLSNTVLTQVNTASITNNDGSLTKSVDKAFADINDIVTYTITVKNSGNVSATNVMVKDTIPTDTSYVPNTLTVDGVANSGNIATGVNIGTINSGQTKVVVFKVKVNTIPNPNPIPNEALVSYGYKVDPVAADRTANGTTNNVQTKVNTARINSADGGLVKTVDKGYGSVGEVLTYTITLRNTGNVTATDIIVKDTIPMDTTYVLGSALLNGVAATGDPMVGIQASSLAPNAQAVVSFKVSVNTIPTPNPIPNRASVNYAYVVDTVLGTTNSQTNLTNIVQTTISQANIKPEDGGFTKTVDKSEADVGDVLTYTIVLKNTGNIPATNVVVRDTIPNDTSYVASSLKVNGVANAGNIQTGINIGTINPNAIITVQFQVHVDRIPNPNPIVNQAKVSYSFLVGTTTKSEEHLTEIAKTTINNAYIDNSNGGLVKATSKDYAKVGDTITYTFTLKNTGNIAANNIILKDTIPAETSFVPSSVIVGGVANGSASPSTGIPVGTVTSGQTVIVTFDVIVTSIPSTNPIKNSGTVTYTYTVDSSVPNGKTGSGNSNIVPTTINTAVIPGYPKRGIVKSVDMAFADIDDILTYTVVMKNEGNVPAINVVMQDTIPNDTAFVTGSATSNGSPISGNPNTGLSVSDIPPLGVVTVTFKVKVNTLPNPNPIPNNATANYSYIVNPITKETGSGSDTSNQVTTQVNTARITAPDGGLIKNVDYLYADVGQTITYTILLNNSGNIPATSVTIQDTIPNDTTFIPGSVTINGTTQAGANPNTGIFVGTLTPFSANTITFKVKVNTIPTPNPIPNACTVGYSYITNTITNISKNVKFPSNIVYTKVNNANIDTKNGGLVKSVDKSFGAINDTLTYAIVVKNTGNVDALNVLFKDTIPNSTMLIPGSVTVNGVINSTANLSTGIPLGTVPPNMPTTIQFKVLVTDTMPNTNPIPNTGAVSYEYIVDNITQTPIQGSGISNKVETKVNAAIINNTDGTLSKSANKTYVDLGDTITYTIVIGNTGNTVATNVFFMDTIPEETTFVINTVKQDGALRPGIYPESGFTLANINPGTITTISFDVTVTSIPAVNPILNKAFLGYSYKNDPLGANIRAGYETNEVQDFVNRAVIGSSSDGSLVKSLDKAFAKVGDTITYTVDVKNTGNVSANNLFIYDTIPSYTSFVSGSVVVNGIVSGTANPQSGINLGTLNSGSTAQIKFKVTVTSIPLTNEIKNEAVAKYSYTVDPSLPNSKNSGGISNIVTTTIGTAVITGPPGSAGASNAGSKSANPNPANIGDTVVYSIAVYNGGNILGTNVKVYDTTPTGTTFVPNSVKVDGIANPGETPETGMTVGNLAPKQTKTVTFSVIVNTLVNPGVITNIARISYNFTTDPSVPGGEVGTGVTNLTSVPINTASFGNLNGQSGLTKTVSSSFVKVSDTVTYTIDVKNLGNVTALGVIFEDTVPSGTQFIQDSLTVDGVAQNGAAPDTGVNLGNILPGAMKQVQFKVKVLTIPNPNPFVNEALVKYNYNVSSTDNRTGANLSNKVQTTVNTAIIGEPLGPGQSGGSGILKSADKQNADIGDTVTYTLAVKNTGNVNAENVVVTDIIPNGTTFVPNSVTIDSVSQPGLNPTNGIDLGIIAPNRAQTVTFKVLVVSIPSGGKITNKPSGSFAYTVDPANPGGETGTFGGNVVTIPANHAEISTIANGLIKSLDLEFATLGDTITYTIVLKNTGSINATNVKVYDTVPNGTSYIPNSILVNNLAQSASTPTTGINVGTLMPNAVATVIFKVLVTTVPSVNPIPNTADVAYNYNVDPSIVKSVRTMSNMVDTQMNYVDLGNTTKDGSPKYAKVGDTVTYTITVPNSGNTAVNNVLLKDTIPAGTTFVANSATVSGIANSGNPETSGIQVGTINPNSSVTVTFKVLVVSIPSTNKLDNQARLSYSFTKDPSNPDGVTGSELTNINSISITNAQIVGPPGTEGSGNGGTKVGNTKNAAIGDVVTYTITLLNSGNVPATNVVIKDTIPECTSLVNGSVLVNGTPSTDTPSTGINVGTINPGNTAIVKYSVKVMCLKTPPPAELVNTATINYDFVTDPSLPKTPVTTGTNTSTIPVSTASFGNNNGQSGLVKSVNKAFADRGDTLTYTIILTNTGNVTANNVIFKDTIPTDTSFVVNSVTIDGVAQNGVNPQNGVSLGNILASNSKEVKFNVLVLTLPMPNPIPNSSRVSYSFTVDPSVPNGRTSEDMSNKVETKVNFAMIGVPTIPGTNTGSGILKSSDKAYADIGDTVTYTFVVKNTGNVVAENVVVKDTIPQGSVFVADSVMVNGSQMFGENPENGINVGNVNPNETKTVTFKTTVVSIPTNKNLVDTPSVSYGYKTDPNGPLTNVSGGGNTVTIPVNNANISTGGGGLNKSASPSYITIGDTITYTVVMKNNGSVDALNVKVLDTLQNGIVFVAGSSKVNNVSKIDNPTTTGILVGTVMPSQTATVTFMATVNTIPVPNPVSNTAKIIYDYKPTPTVIVTVTNPTNTTETQTNYAKIDNVAKDSDVNYVKVGDVVTYTITIPNTGNVDANNVVFKDTIPSGSSFVPNSGKVNGSQVAGQDPQTGINIGTINAGSQAVVEFKVTVLSVPASGKLSNQARVNFTFTKDPQNPNGVSGNQISNVNTVSVTNAQIVGPPGTPGASNNGSKTSDKTVVDIGDTVNYTITLLNSGNTPAFDVMVKDTIPNCTTLVNGSVKVNGNTSTNTPQPGIFVGTIPAGATAIVKYAVKVTCLNTPPPAILTNQADISYKFITDPSLPPTVVTGQTNLSTIPVTTAGFKINGQSGIVKSVDKAFATRGDVVTYTINLTNNGNTSANNVVFKDTIPNDTSYVQDSLSVDGVLINGASPQSGVSVGTILASSSKEIKFKVIVLTVPTPNPIPNTARAEYTYTVDPSIPNGRSNSDMSNLVTTDVKVATIGSPLKPGETGSSGVLKSSDTQNADIGDTVTYTLVLKNTGNAVAKNVIVYDTIANGSTFISDSVTVDNVAVPGAHPENGVDIGNISANQTVTVKFKTLVVSIPASKALTDTPRVDYSFTIDPSSPDVSVSGGGNTVTIPVNHASISTTDGGFVKSQNPSHATVGDTITYTMIAKNTGSVNAENVKVYDNLDSSLQFVNGSVKVNGVSQAASNPMTTGINVGTLIPNGVATITFNTLVLTLPNPNPLKNQAVIQYTYKKDPNTVVSVTNPSNVTTGEIKKVDLGTMVKDSNANYVKVGDIVTYTITIPNTGNADATNVVLKDTIPAGASFVNSSAKVNGVAQPGSNPETTGINVGTINASSQGIVEFKVVVVSVPASGKLTNQARTTYSFTVDPSVPDGRTGSKNSNVNVTTVTNASLVGPPGTPGATNAGSKTSDKSIVDVGDTVTYTISILNSGNVPAFDVIVKDTIPACTSIVNGSVKVNGISVSDTPMPGINVGTIASGQTAVIKYSVKVNCLKTPPPAVLTNQADIGYKFTTDPSLPPTVVTGPTNISTIPVTTAGFNINGQNGIVKSVDKAFADRGSTVTYTISLTNNGNTTANNVMLIDTIPNDTSYIQDSLTLNGNPVNGANPNGGVSIGSIAANETVIVSFIVQVLTVPNPNPMVNAALVNYNYTVNPSIPDIRSGKDLSNTVKTQVNTAMIGKPGIPGSTGSSGVLKTASPTNADIGTTVTYTLSLTNTGNTTAKNVVVSDTVPVGSIFIPNTVKVNGGVVPGADPNAGIDLGNIGPNQTVTVIFQAMTVSIPPSKSLVDSPSVEYSYTVDPSLPDTNVTGGGNTVTVPVNNASISTTDGGFVKSQDPSFVTVGDTVTYTMIAKNTGSVPATNVKVTDNLDSSLQFVAGSVKINNVLSPSANPNTGITVGTLNPNAIATITFSAKVITVPNPNPILNKASVTYNYNVDPNTVVTTSNPSNVTSGKVNYVDVSKMSKSGSPTYVKLGDVLTYTITIPNNGNVDANNVLLKDTIPQGTSFLANSVYVNGIQQGSIDPQVTGINVGTINPGTEAVVKFSITVNSIPQSGAIENTAASSYTYTVDPSVPDGRTGSGSSNKETTTVTNASLVGPPGTEGAGNSGTKTGNTKNADIGDTVTYTITLFNSGNVPAINTMIHDTIPTCTTLVNGSVTVNGISNSGTPSAGIKVGTIPAGATAVVKYSVKVTCLNTPPPATLKNQATIDYGFITDPTKPPTTVTGVTNVSTIPVTTAGFNINGQNGIVKEVSKEFADRGDILTYTITLTNLGNTMANNVMFVDTLPNDTSYVQDSLTLNGNGINGANPNTGVSLGNIGAGSTAKIMFKVQVLTVPNPNPLVNAALASYSYTVNPSIPNGKSSSNLSNLVNTKVNTAMIGKPGEPGSTGGSGVLKTASPTNADIGTTVTYTLSLTNAGNAIAKNVVVSDTIAAGSTLIPNTVKINGIAVPGANPNVGIDLGNIGPNQTVTVIFQAMTVSIPPSKALVDTPSVEYSYTVDPSLPDTTVTGGGTTVTVPVNHASISTTDGGFVKSQDPSYATTGDIITYTVVVKNTGSVEATNVTIVDTLASSVSFIPNSVTINGVQQGSLVTPISGIVVGTIAPNGVYTVTFKVKVITVPNPNPILNKAKVIYSYKPDPNTVVTTSNPSNVTSGQINYVNISKMNKSGDLVYVKLGDVLTYTITIPNSGNVDANNVLLKDTLPKGTSFVNNSVFINGINQGGMNPENPGIQIGTINAGSSAIVKFSVTVNSIPQNGVLENTATSSYTYTVDPSVPDGREGTGNSNKETTTVTNASLVGPPGTAGANNAGTKVGTPTNVDIGDTVNYSITLYNSGNVPAVNAMIYDTIPTCTSLVNGSVKINGVATSDTPGNGIKVGTIPAGQTVVVNYAVKVTCLNTPPPATLTNTANINYEFITDPSKPPTKVTGTTNTSTIPVTTAGFNVNGQNGMVKTATPDFVDVGDTVTFTIAMTNLGNTVANDVVLIDTIPNGTEFNQGSVVINGVANPTANPNGGINLGNIPSGSTVTIKFTVKVLDIPTQNPIQNQATANYTYTVNPSIPNGRVGQNNSNTTSNKVNNAIIGDRVTPGSPNGSGVFKAANPTIADIGDTVTYTFVITNNGNVIAQNVVLTDSMSDGLVFVSGSVTVNGASRPSDNPSNGINLGNVGVGVTNTITFKATVTSLPKNNAVVDTPIINYSYRVDPNGPIKNVTGGGTTVTVPVNVAIISSKDGGITKNVNPSHVTIGDKVTYTITVKNTGSIEANSVMVYDTLQNGLVFVKGSVKANGLIFPSADPTLGIALGTVYVNQTVTVTFEAIVNTVPMPNPISNTANVGYTYKPTPNKVVTVTNPSPTTSTPVNYVDLSNMNKSSDPSYVQRADTITYTIVIPNNGNTAANNVMVSDSLPFGVTFVQNSVFVNGVNQTGVDPEVTGINVGSILPSSSATVTFKALVNTIPSNGLMKNKAKASYVYTVNPSKPNCREGSIFSNINTVTVTDANLIAPPSVPCSKHNGKIKYADKDVLGIGDIVTYTVQVYNDGNIPATNVIVNDTIVNCGEFVLGSVIVNGISMPTQTVSGGITIGVINPKETGYVMYKVKAKCLPLDGKLVNTASINYSFIKDPRNEKAEAVTMSNTVTIPVLLAGFGVKECTKGVVKAVDKVNATVGEVITYTVSMCNGGNVPALNVKFIDTIPQGTSFIEDSFSLNNVIIPNANPEGGVNLGTINASSKATVSFKVKVVSIPNPNPILNDASVKYEFVVDPSLPNRSGTDTSNIVSTRIKFAVIGDQVEPGNPSGSGLVKLADKTTVDIGDVVTFSLIAKNTGNVDAENVVVFDTLPSAVSFVPNSVLVNGVPQLSSNPINGIDVGNISPGTLSTVIFKAIVISIPEGGKIINSGFVDYSYTVDSELPGGVTNQALGNTITIPVNTAIISTIKNGFIKKTDKAYAKIGEVVTYTVLLTNKGTVNATNARIFDTIPNGLSFITGSVTVDGASQNSNPQTGILVGTVKPFVTRTVTFKAIVVSVPNINPIPNLCDVVYSYDTEGGI